MSGQEKAESQQVGCQRWRILCKVCVSVVLSCRELQQHSGTTYHHVCGSDTFRLNGVNLLHTTKYEMLIAKYGFSVLESVGIVEVFLRWVFLLLFVAHCSGVASPDLQRFYCLCEDMTSRNVMSEAGVRVIPELLVRQTLNVTGSENRVLSRMFFRPVWPTYRSNHNTHVLVRGISRASTENSSLPGRFYFICHVWTCDKVIDPNPGEGTPWPCM